MRHNTRTELEYFEGLCGRNIKHGHTQHGGWCCCTEKTTSERDVTAATATSSRVETRGIPATSDTSKRTRDAKKTSITPAVTICFSVREWSLLTAGCCLAATLTVVVTSENKRVGSFRSPLCILRSISDFKVTPIPKSLELCSAPLHTK